MTVSLHFLTLNHKHIRSHVCAKITQNATFVIQITSIPKNLHNFTYVRVCTSDMDLKMSE